MHEAKRPTSSSLFNTSAGLRLSYSLDALLGVAGASLSLGNKGGEPGDAIAVLLREDEPSHNDNIMHSILA